MMLRLSLTCMLAVACTHPASHRQLPLTEALLELAREWSDERGYHAMARRELNRMAIRVRVIAGETQRSLRDSLAQVVFEEYGFTREVEDKSLRYVFLPTVLSSKRGSCVGLGSLYLALAERLGLDMQAILVPGHFYVRLREAGDWHNLELLRRGEAMPDSFYVTRWPMRNLSVAYARPLSSTEIQGVLLYDIGNELRRAGAYHRAERAFSLAGQRFGDLGEAHASAGSMAHLLGALDRAESAYAAARAADPELPGLRENIALLEAERAGSLVSKVTPQSR